MGPEAVQGSALNPRINPEKWTCVYVRTESLTLRAAINKAEGRRGSHTGCCSKFASSVLSEDKRQRRRRRHPDRPRPLRGHSANSPRSQRNKWFEQREKRKFNCAPGGHKERSAFLTVRGRRLLLFWQVQLEGGDCEKMYEILKIRWKTPKAGGVRDDPSSRGPEQVGKTLTAALATSQPKRFTLDLLAQYI